MSILSRFRALLTFGRGVVAGLSEQDAGDDPIGLFRSWFDDARRAGIYLPEAMTVSTSTPDGRPSARIMLLKGADESGFVFFTNYGSRKAGDLERNPRVALTFHWSTIQRQVRVEATVVKLRPEESAEYFDTRPRGSRIGAWASRQSEPLDSRHTLSRRVDEISERFRGAEIPLPEFWGGYRAMPDRIEFWQGRANRLHDRLLFVRRDHQWERSRLYP